MIQELYKEFSQLKQVEAIALGGSRAGQDYDQNSDYDVYIYLNSPIDEETRQIILSNYCSYMEIGNQFWELEDDCILNNGIQIELIYRSLESFEQELNSTVFQHQAQNAYTTCMWHNLLHSKILYDPNGRYTSLQRAYQIPYPQELKKHIIEKQLLLLPMPTDLLSGEQLKTKQHQTVPQRLIQGLTLIFHVFRKGSSAEAGDEVFLFPVPFRGSKADGVVIVR